MGAIVITGVPGVGKSTVINAAAEASKLKVVVYGTEMFQLAKERGLVEHRDQMRALPPDTQRELQEAAAKRIAGMGDVIVDTHCTIKTPRGFLPGLPEWVAKGLDLRQVILVEADPAEIAARRAKDATRVRDEDQPASIDEHQRQNRYAAWAVATLTGATVATVLNRDGRVEDAKQSVIRVMAGRP
jgi:adenylate kinase